jgi:hypothetical protein
MSTEVYLLSIPLARHRSIVPRRRDVGIMVGDSQMRPLEQRVFGIADAIVESPPRAGSLQRIDTH